MNVYVNKSGKGGCKRIALDDMILTTELPTTAGSKMLENYVSLFEAEAVSRLTQAGYEISGKVNKITDFFACKIKQLKEIPTL